MSEIKQENKAPDAAIIAQQPEVQPKSAIKPHMSRGEKIYNWTVYQGINYWVNLISSIAIADYFTHKPNIESSWLPKWYREGGRDWLDKGINKTAIGLSNTKIIDLKTAHHHSKVAFETGALTFGGWLLLIPSTLMENNKRSIVHWLNKKLGVNQTAPDGHELTPDEIYIEKEQPKQSWGRAVTRRLYAMGSVIGTGLLLDKFYGDKSKPLEDKTYHLSDKPEHTVVYTDRHLGGKDRLEHNIVDATNTLYKFVPGKAGNLLTKPEGLAQRWTALAALDTIFTGITAGVMKLTNGAAKKKMPNEIATEQTPPAAVETVVDEEAPEKKFAYKAKKREQPTARESFAAGLAAQDANALGIGA